MIRSIATIFGAIILPIAVYISALLIYRLYYWIARLLNLPEQHYVATIGTTIFVGVVIGLIICWVLDWVM